MLLIWDSVSYHRGQETQQLVTR